MPSVCIVSSLKAKSWCWIAHRYENHNIWKLIYVWKSCEEKKSEEKNCAISGAATKNLSTKQPNLEAHFNGEKRKQ